MAKVTRLSEKARALEKNKAKGHLSSILLPQYCSNLPADYDPEDDAFDNSDEEQSDSDNNPPPTGGREHYEAVGKSKLRKSEKTSLDAAKYGGIAISRKALENQGSDEDVDEDDENDPFALVDEGKDDDPFAKRGGNDSGSEHSSSSSLGLDDEAEVDEDDEIDSDEALGESDYEKFKNFTFRGSKNNQNEPHSGQEESSQVSSEDEDNSTGSETEDSDLDMQDAEDSQDEDNDSLVSSTSSPPPKPTRPARNSEREELRKAASLSASTADLASALSAGATADAKKGQAVMKQQKAFDRILDARIKLQKGLTAANDLAKSTLSDEQVSTAARQAEDAALKLWSTINSIRYGLISAQPTSSKAEAKSLKRKRPSPVSHATTSSAIWQETVSLDAQSHSYHRAALDKWHVRTQPAIDASARSKLLGRQSQPQSRLTDVLTTYLTTTSANLISSSTADDALYDDTPFYQNLLRDLIASRSSADQSLAMSVDSYLPTKLHASGSRNKKVDTKASKGRKIRYTVHEKLQNFMAPEDRTSWEDGAATEFFASLLGRTAVLDEDDEDHEDGSDEDDTGRDGSGQRSEEVALRLFRS